MGKNLRTAGDLISAGLMSEATAEALGDVLTRWSISLTPDVAELIDVTDPDDPIARQFVPFEGESIVSAGELADPIGDDVHAAVTGIIHRYPDRVLFKPLNVCPVYCRFCFRRESVGPGGLGMLNDAELTRAIEYIAAKPSIWEVVISGGDPLVLSAKHLTKILRRLGDIDHVKVIRIHTRVPVVKPDLVSPVLVRALKAFGRAVFVALHANHPREFTAASREACARLVDAGVPMVSQTVLLRGVNDSASTMETLMRTFVENRIKPYYLHHGDLAPGTGHFRLSIREGQRLLRGLRGSLSGLAQPTFVLDIPGGYGKVPIGPNYIREMKHGQIKVSDPRGREHAYPPRSSFNEEV